MPLPPESTVSAFPVARESDPSVIYLTRKPIGSAVYRSQVIGTCEYLRDVLRIPVRLLALTGPRRVIRARRWLSPQFADSTVLPLFPSALLPILSKGKHWRRHLFVLRLYLRFRRSDAVIARGVEATNLALALRDQGLVRKVCYDGRGAVAAESMEYVRPDDERGQQNTLELERDAVLRSDFRLSVSEQLVRYWRDRYGYEGRTHAVVPCALKEGEQANAVPNEEGRRRTRAALNFGDDDTVLAYAGGLAGWQSLGPLAEALREWLGERSDLKVLFLARDHPAITDLQRAFPVQVRRRFVNPGEVQALLAAADYGLLLREPSTTNAVAAPTKFAEYLAAGLAVMISPGIGDYSEFVQRHGCGHVVHAAGFPIASLNGRSDDQRQACSELARRYFARSAYRKEYQQVVEALLSE